MDHIKVLLEELLSHDSTITATSNLADPSEPISVCPLGFSTSSSFQSQNSSSSLEDSAPVLTPPASVVEFGDQFYQQKAALAQVDPRVHLLCPPNLNCRGIKIGQRAASDIRKLEESIFASLLRNR